MRLPFLQSQQVTRANRTFRSMSYPPIYLLRHGQTEWNVAARLQGRFDSALTEQGRAQAARQGEILAQLWPELHTPAIFCSPLGRTRASADIALEPLHARYQLDSRLREISAGSWDGTYLDEIERKNGPLFEQSRNAFHLMFLAPDGEGELSVLQRCQSFLDELTGTSVVFTHGATLCVLRGLLRGLEFDEMLDLSHEQGCIYAIENGTETILR